MLESLYLSRETDKIEALGNRYKPPVKFPHADWVQVASVQKERGSDGQSVKVFECACPARFYKVVALKSVDSVGNPLPPLSVALGSGNDMAQLAGLLAMAISEGMVIFRPGVPKVDD